ncbi:MAG TPA: hypothetical protein VM286_03225 [Candidatus Thermoplasmatota archaeon]|nr:hypothetical protein [Candidatus Thermoplasmatota archaeon]
MPQPVPYVSPDDEVAAALFFKDRPQAAALLAKFVDSMRPVRAFTVTATKSRVALMGRTRFLWCNAANLDGSIVVRFLLPCAVPSDRVRHDEAGNRYSIRIHLRTAADLDAGTMAWFREAHQWDARGE